MGKQPETVQEKLALIKELCEKDLSNMKLNSIHGWVVSLGRQLGTMPIPPPKVTIRMGSALVHFDEYNSADGHDYDLTAARSLLEDENVVQWMEEMSDLSLLPKKRTK